MDADAGVEILVDVERWHLRYSWGIGDPVDSIVLPEHMRHGPRFLNAMELEVLGKALHLAGHQDVPTRMTLDEIDGPEPAAHDAQRVKVFVGVGRAEFERTLRVSSGLTRGALLALHHTLAHAEEPRLHLLCAPFEPTGLGKQTRADVIRLSVGPR